MSTPLSVPNVSQTIYMQGTRRLDEIVANARQLGYQENYSYTEGWDDNTLAAVSNLALNEIYDKITQVDEVANIQEFATTVYSQVQSYPIPQDVKMAQQIMNVRYLYGPESWQFVTLEQGMIQDRFSYPTNIPSTYCIRNGQMLLSPTPNITRQNALIVNFQKRMRSLDYRRGKINVDIISPYGTVTNISNASPAVVTTSAPHGLLTGAKVGLGGIFTPGQLIDQTFIITFISPTSFSLNNTDTTLASGSSPFTATPACIWYANPVQFQLNFNVTSQKDVNLQANANAILNKIDWVCIVDRNGSPIIDAIPVNNYNMVTFVLTAEADYVIPYANWLLFENTITFQDTLYVVQGDYSSSHSELDRAVEDLLIEYIVLRLLRLQSAAEPTQYQLEAEKAVLDRIRIAYRRYRPAVVPIVWQQRLRARSYSGGYGPRGVGF